MKISTHCKGLLQDWTNVLWTFEDAVSDSWNDGYGMYSTREAAEESVRSALTALGIAEPTKVQMMADDFVNIVIRYELSNK